MMKNLFKKKPSEQELTTEISKIEVESLKVNKLEEENKSQIAKIELSTLDVSQKLIEQQQVLKEKQENLKGLKSQVTKAQALLRETETSHNKALSEKNRIEKQITDSKVNIDKLEYQLKKLDEETDDNKKSYNRSLKLVDELNKKTTQLDWEIKNAESNLEVEELKYNTQEILASKLQKDVLNLESQKSTLKSEIDVLKAKTDRIAEVITSNQSYRETLSSEYNKLVTFKASREEKLKKVTDKNIALNVAIENLKDQIQDLKEPVDVLESKINQLLVTIEEQSNELSTLEKDLDDKREAKMSKESYVVRQEHLRHTNKKKLAERQQDIGKLDLEIQKVNKKIENIEREILLQNKMLISRSEKSEKQSKIYNELIVKMADQEALRNDYMKKLSSLKEKIKENDVVINDKSVAVAELTKKIEDQESEIFDLSLRKGEQEKTLEKSRTRLEGQQQKVNHQKEMIANYQSDIARQRNKIDELELTNQRTKKQIDQLVIEANELKTQIENGNNEIVTLSTIAANLDDELKKANYEVRSLSKSKESIRGEITVLESKNREREHLLKNQTEYVEALTNELVATEEELTRKEEQKQNLVSQIDVARSRERTLNQQNLEVQTKLQGICSEVSQMVKDESTLEKLQLREVERLFAQERVSTDVLARISKKVSDYQNKNNQREVILRGNQEKLERNINHLNREILSLKTADEKQRGLTTDIDQCEREIVRTHMKINEIEKRVGEKENMNSEKMIFLEGVKGKSEELATTLKELEGRDASLTAEIAHRIEDINKREAENKRLSDSTSEMKEKVAKLNRELDLLQTRERNNRQLILGQTEQGNDLAHELEKLEALSSELETKVSLQEEQMTIKSNYISKLADENKALSIKIKNLDDRFDRNRQTLTDSEGEIKSLEQKVKLSVSELRAKEGHSNVTEVEREIEESLTVSLMNAFSGMIKRLETRHFNLSMSQEDIKIDSREEFKNTALPLFENIVSRYVDTIESRLSATVDSFCNVSHVDSRLTAFISVGPFEQITNEGARMVLVPFTKKLMDQYRGDGIDIKFKVKLSTLGTIDKLGITVSIPTKSIDSSKEQLKKAVDQTV